jgi:hypothetical protein
MSIEKSNRANLPDLTSSRKRIIEITRPEQGQIRSVYRPLSIEWYFFMIVLSYLISFPV